MTMPSSLTCALARTALLPPSVTASAFGRHECVIMA